MKRTKRIIGFILDDLFVFSPILFGFYLSVVLYFVFNGMNFNFTLFPIPFFVLLSLILCSDKAKFYFLELKKQKINYFIILWGNLFCKIKSTKKIQIVKVFFICLIYGFFLIKGANLIELTILVYGGISVFFGVYKKYSLIFSIIILVFIPFLMVFELSLIAENAAIYTFYFLLIFFIAEIFAPVNKAVDK